MTITGNQFSYQYPGVYDKFGRLISQTGPNGLTQTFSFNDAGQLASMTYGLGTTWQRTYDSFGRVFQETDPDGSTTTYNYDSASRLATAASNTLSEAYLYDSSGNRTSSTINGNTSTHTFNSESQLTNAGYVYDALGRNTFIPAIDAPANNAGIALSYNLVDQVTNIAQGLSSTTFTYDALGRRVNETVGSLTTVRHYSGSSDNPEWTTQLSATNLTTEIYTGSLGAGLAVTTTFKGAVRTSSLQLTDVRGHTVTTLNLDTNSVGAWSVYDSFGNPQTSQTNTNLINYSSYGQQERATNSTGLILVGARVYNPETNQFTSKDPIKGGNENSYTYPNDPMNTHDFSGLDVWLSIAVWGGAALLSLGLCALTAGVGCLAIAVGVSGLGGSLEAYVEGKAANLKDEQLYANVAMGGLVGGISGFTGGTLAPVLRGSLAASRFYKIGLKIDKYPKTSEMLYGTILEKTTESHFSQVFKYSNNNQAKGSTGLLEGKKKPIQKLKGGYR
jgi:RHS repeat-associated protein